MNKELNFTGERYIPEYFSNSCDEIVQEHEDRYISISNLITDKVVLDAACGSGYGSFEISKYAKSVSGVDISVDSIKYAKKNYLSNNLEFNVGSVTELPFSNNEFDVVVSFETIEHIGENQQLLFLKEIKRVLKDNGVLIISTPDKLNYSDKKNYKNEFHIKEFYENEFFTFLNSFFKNVEFYYQTQEVCNLIYNSNSKTVDLKTIFNQDISGKYIIAVCSNIDLNDCMRIGITSIENNKNNFLNDRIISLQNEVEEKNKWAIGLNSEIDKINEIIKNLSQDLETKENYYSYKIKNLENDKANLENDKANLENDINIVQNSLSWKFITFLRKMKMIITKPFIIFKSRNDYKIIKESGLFDTNYYLETYEDVSKKGIDPIKHYLKYGWKEGRNSSRFFCTNFYLEIYSDVKNCSMDPLIHFIKYGWKEGRNPSEEFDTKKYLDLYDDVKKAEINPLFHYMKYGKNEGRISNYNENSYFQSEIKKFKELFLKNVIDPMFNKIDLNQKLIVPIFEKPKVSIIIPAYNQVDYTYNTVFSIIKSIPKISYEIIIADDNSSDNQARELNKAIENIKFFTNEENLGFTKNCNKGAKFASGEFILFLNNDTYVIENWLDSLVELIESDNSIGMVGSKLVYPDGRQQEAGGIIWNDASGWNFGRLANPLSPEYSYVKEVDYISGASIMLSRQLWEKIGGFDERYAPAYFEDSDLAFEVRKHGYKVMFQPKSIVVHFEGISHGTDTEKGTKSYQIRNKEKFIDKWKDELDKNQFENGQNIFLARDRSRDKKHILIIDHYVPHFDQDAGSRTIFSYIRLFLNSNFSITFIGDNYAKHEPYTSILEQMGVEILYGADYQNNIISWLDENLKYFDYIFINRPHITQKYIDIFRNYSNIKILYYGHDLHFLRDYREYKLTDNEEKLKQSNIWKKIEIEIMNKVDISLYPSSVEVEEIKKINNEIVVKAIPAYLFENFNSLRRDIKDTKNLMFVGGFSHTPNVDAVLWFVNNVWNEVKRQLPEIKFYIIGSKPTKEILSLANENIIVTGFISDDELKDYYKSTRIAIVPLRYGAGIKGKVVEALYEQIPIITTTIGAEGLYEAEDYMLIEDSAINFANRIIRTYTDENELFRLSVNGNKYCSKYFSYDSFKLALEEHIDFGENK